MPVNMNNTSVAKVGAGAYAIVTDATKTALELRGLLVNLDSQSPENYLFTNGSNTASGTGASTSDIGEWIFNNATWEFYEIVGAVNGASITLDRNYDGPSGSHTCIIWTPDPEDGSVSRSGLVWGADP